MNTLDPSIWTQLIVSASNTEKAVLYTEKLIHTCFNIAESEKAKRIISEIMRENNEPTSI